MDGVGGTALAVAAFVGGGVILVLAVERCCDAVEQAFGLGRRSAMFLRISAIGLVIASLTLTGLYLATVSLLSRPDARVPAATITQLADGAGEWRGDALSRKPAQRP